MVSSRQVLFPVLTIKLLHPTSSLLWYWVVFFTLSTTCFAGVFLMLWAGLYILFDSIPFERYWVGAGSLLSGAYCASRVVHVRLRERRIEHENTFLAEGEHRLLGAYRYNPYRQFWFTFVTLDSEVKVRLSGHGVSPSPNQVFVWSEVIVPQKQALLEVARRSLPPPPKRSICSIEQAITLQKIDLLDGDEFELSFDAGCISEEINLWPTVRFSKTSKLLSTAWVP